MLESMLERNAKMALLSKDVKKLKKKYLKENYLSVFDIFKKKNLTTYLTLPAKN